MPPAKFVFENDERRGSAFDSLVSGGCIISGSSVRRSRLVCNVPVPSNTHIHDTVILPDGEVDPHVMLRNCIIDRYCALPAGLQVGVDPDEDRKRFHVTERGVTLVTPEMLGQHVHGLP